MTLQKSTIQWELMLPEEFRAAMERLPVCFMPLGTVEWHGEHDALGLDSLKAHALCIRAAGDLVMGYGSLLHASHGNQTDERRTVLTMWYYPDYVALRERTQATVASVKVHNNLSEMVTALEQADIPYQIDSSTTLFVHGIDVFIKDVDIMIQIDHFEDAHTLVQHYDPPPITDTNGWIQFHIFPQGVDVHFLTTKKMTDLASHADRVRVTHQDTTFWSLSVDWCRRHTPDDHERAPIIDQYLAERDPSHTP